MKRMLINATHSEELRVALVDGQKLYDLDIEVPALEQKKSNIYKGTITRVEPSLEAVFVDYGSERHGFLPFKEITGFAIGLETQEISNKSLIKKGQEVVVQVEKEERGNKGSALTTQISLAGSYLVLMPNNPGSGGISRRIDGDNRTALREVLDQLDIPDTIGLIVRTAGVGKSVEELQWDLNYLTHLWEAISRASEDRKAPYLIFQESNFVIRSIRDYLRADIDEVLIDSSASYNLAHDFMQQIMPQYLSRVKLYEDSVPLFTRYQIESQIETAYGREVPLSSGGSIVIDPTEALTSIDINSARATKGSDFESTALNINLEAADEIARQLRIRDMGGLFVIDFIDMGPAKNQRMVEARIKEAMKHDRARIQFSKISRFGLLEMSRQRIHSSLTESSLPVCPRCHGQGTIRSVESLSLSVIRILEEEAMKDQTARVIVQLPVDCATFILNEKRTEIQQIEKSHQISLVIVPNKHLETPHYEIERVRIKEAKDDTSASHERAPQDKKISTQPYQREQQTQQKAAVQNVMPSTPQPTSTQNNSGFFKRILNKIIPATANNEVKKEPSKPQSTTRRAQQPRPPRPKRTESQNRNKNSQRQNTQGNKQNKAPHKKPSEVAANAPNVKKVETKSDSSSEKATTAPRKRRRNRRSSNRSNENKTAIQNNPATTANPTESAAVKSAEKPQAVDTGKQLSTVPVDASPSAHAKKPEAVAKPTLQKEKTNVTKAATPAEQPSTPSHGKQAIKEHEPVKVNDTLAKPGVLAEPTPRQDKQKKPKEVRTEAPDVKPTKQGSNVATTTNTPAPAAEKTPVSASPSSKPAKDTPPGFVPSTFQPNPTVDSNKPSKTGVRHPRKRRRAPEQEKKASIENSASESPTPISSDSSKPTDNKE